MSAIILDRLTGTTEVTPGWMETRGRRSVATGAGAPPRPPDIAHDGVIAPGLCDLQVNGTGVAAQTRRTLRALDAGPPRDEPA